MKSLRGFGKKYFTLSCILAHAVSLKLHNKVLTFKNYEIQKLLDSSKEIKEESSPDDELLSINTPNLQTKSYHNNWHFNKINILLNFFKFNLQYLYYFNFSSLKKSGIDPP